MSSSRESVGDLVPQDMLEVFAQERQSKRSKRTRRRGTFSRAFTWLKGRRRKTPRTNKDTSFDLLTPGSPLEIPLLPSITAPKVQSETPLPVQHFPENVFIEGNRPKYLEDLHTEAQEGLKLLQQDENRNGVDFQDDQSVISTVTARTDDDMSFSELRMSECESTTADTISTRSMRSTRSTISYQSSRSGLTRQGSSFRPLKEDRKHAKSKSKGRNICTNSKIPRHVQKELGLDRAAWTASQFTSAQLSNGGLSISTVVPTLDGISIASIPDGALMLQRSLNSAQAIKENKPQLPLAEGQRDDLSLLLHLLPQSSDPQRPGSLAAPWMPTTSGNCPSSPVMYVSPEATYMSKIIPNAVLPPSVDVVELKRNRSRSSVRMVSKSSLASASPAPSRASSRASSRPSSRFSSRLSSRASSYRTGPLSEYSGCSNSESSETLVSDSSTISSSSTPRVTSRASHGECTDGPLKIIVHNNLGGQSVLGNHDQLNGDNKQEDTWRKMGTSEPFRRSLSVVKKSKNPPPPPSRSYSLHMQHSHKVAHTAENKSKNRMGESPGSKYNLSLNVVSPYSDCTNQNDMPPIVSKGSKPYSNNNEVSHWTMLKDSLPYIKKLSTKGGVPSPPLMALMALLDIPDPPDVLAPPPPPPETWAHNQRTFELLCGPGPVNFEGWAKKRGLKIENPVQKSLGNIPKIVSVPVASPSIHTNGKVVSAFKEKSEQSNAKFQRNQAMNGVKDNIVAPNKPYGKTIALPGLSRLYPSPSPSPPPEHLPPPPPFNQVKRINEDVSTRKAQNTDLPFDELICLPPHPLFPPPPPPVKVYSPHPSVGQHETDTLFPAQKFPPPPQVIPPPPPLVIPHPPQVIPPPPPQAVPPPPQAVPPPPQAVPPPPQAVPPPPQVIPPPPPQVIPPPPPQVIPPPPPQAVPPPPQAVPPPPQAIPPPPQAIPPPPQAIPPPPQATPPPPKVLPSPPKEILPSPKAVPSPPKATPPPPKEIPCYPQDISVMEAQITVNVPPPPPPPPLPTDLKKEVKAITADKQEKPQPLQSPHTVTMKEESPTPVITPSLLQMVRLRSVKSNVSRAEGSPVEKPKQQSNQEVPQKPIRRSLILTSSDLPSLSTSNPKDDTQTTANQGTPPTSNTQPIMEPNIQSGKTVQDAPYIQLEPAPLSDTAKSNSQISVTDQKTQNTSSESPKQSVPDETKKLLSKSELTPKITMQDIQQEVPEPSATAEPMDQPDTTDVKTESTQQRKQSGSNKTEDTPNKTLLQSLPKCQTVTHTANPVSPTQKLPPASGALSSMRLQEAIRLKTAAMSSKDGEARRLNLHSPPPPAGGISPTSTANFIFSKSTKKVVIETASSPATAAGLRKTLVTELVSHTTKPTDSQNKNAKIPPPVAKKPKGELATNNSSETERNADTEHVQSAGQ